MGADPWMHGVKPNLLMLENLRRRRAAAGSEALIFLNTERGGNAVNHAVADRVEDVGPSFDAEASIEVPVKAKENETSKGR